MNVPKKLSILILCICRCLPLLAQVQACPININFGEGSLTHWWAYTGLNPNGQDAGNNPSIQYDTSQGAPGGTVGATSIPEYNLPSVNGIQVITNSYHDAFGNFYSIPVINGYNYGYSIKLGSTSVASNALYKSGFVRGVTYGIQVPPGPAGKPYTMTYAYAMVLENGSHNTNEQPLIQAILRANGNVIACASPKYDLPTFNNSTTPGGQGATLDSAAAFAEGFKPSNYPSPNIDPNARPGTNQHLYDVWWKGWREVTFDLSAYRGMTVTLTFEADNCVPGGHFAYAYIALRNVCNGLQITGDTVGCQNTQMIYSVPALENATYQWTVPAGWSVVYGLDSNILAVVPGSQPGQLIAHEVNSCTDLRDTANVSAVLPTIPGALAGGSEICVGSNASPLTLSGNRGSVLYWLGTTNNGASWDTLTSTATTYSPQNVQATTLYRALVQNGQSCPADTSTGVTVLVDPKSAGGQITPATEVVCAGQFKGSILTLTGDTGSVVAWQSTPTGSLAWADVAPSDTTHTYDIANITGPYQYRAIVKSGACPADTSTVASATITPAQFPQATIDPADTTICYGGSAPLSAVITTGTGYTWTGPPTFFGDTGTANLSTIPANLNAVAKPPDTSGYILTVWNSGCPNPLIDTFLVNVSPKVIVFAGNDTAVVVGQPLQFNAVSNTAGSTFNWTPAISLSNPGISDPIGTYGPELDSIRYLVTATAPNGCQGDTTVLVTVFTTLPDIFVPSAFTPTVNIDNIFKPIYVGISSIQFFRVFNRYGQLVYSTSSMEDGWDGRINGVLQQPQAFVYMVQGTSYRGTPVFRKGTVVLIR